MKRAAILCVLTGCIVGDESRGGAGDETYALAGRTIDYFTRSPVAGVAFETLGLAPELAAASDGEGRFSVEVPVGSSFFVRTAASDHLRPTISDVVRAEAVDIAVFSRADIVRQHATTGVAVQPDTATVYVEIAPFDGQPIAAFPRGHVTIVDPATQRLIARDPYVVGSTGDVDPALDAAAGGLVRFAFLNVEPGAYALVVGEVEHTLVAAAGVTLARVTYGGVPGPAPDTFASVYPLLQAGAQGGLGCANCHGTGGTAQPKFDEAPAQVREALLAGALVELAAPDRSPLLQRPLYEAPADHPNATFLSASDREYQLIRAWIANGAK